MRARARRLAITLWGLALLGLPEAARACPQCAGQNGGGIGRLVLLGSMILFPFGVVAVVLWIIRRIESDPEV